MTSRERILAKVRAGVAGGAPPSAAEEASRRSAVDARLSRHDRHLIPARTSGKSETELTGILRRWLELAGAEMIEAASTADAPAAIGDFLRRHNLPQRVRMGADDRLVRLPWTSEPSLTLDHGRAEPGDTTGITHALAAVAETGTLLVPSGADNPVTLSFLPENNIVLVARGDIVGPLEDALERTRAHAEKHGGLPRTLNMISGPSRSADIGGIPVLGAHGPRRLCVIIVG